VYLIDKPGAAQSVVRIGHLGPVRTTTDWFALEVLNTILGGAFTSRLNQNLRETRGYTYGALLPVRAAPAQRGVVALASVVTAKTDSSLIEFLTELRRIRGRSSGPAELAKEKGISRSACRGTSRPRAEPRRGFRELALLRPAARLLRSLPGPALPRSRPPTCSAGRGSTSIRPLRHS